ncbi:MAG: transketolase family protein [Clostridiales Family XIII bacterium]|jgi:transketolase|nr:transketolase family protein [Clostridiales Family XIII bacterium]
MGIVLSKENVSEKTEMRAAYCEGLMELARDNWDIIALDADLMGAMGTKPFQKMYPERAVDCGVQEANLFGVAAGMSAVGYIPFAHTFACFASRRACDQIFISGAYARLNVKVVGSDPGITAMLNGGTHMAFEDMGIMRGIPDMTVLEPTDTVMLKALMHQVVGKYGMHYLRLVRKNVNKVYEEGSSFEIGKAVLLREGGDLTIVSSGYCVAESIKATEILAEQGIEARHLNMFTWKPLDEAAIIRAAEETGAIVTAENHNTVTGLASAVASVLSEHCPVWLETVGVRDEFGDVGSIEYLSERYKLSAPHIVTAAKKALAKKAGR